MCKSTFYLNASNLRSKQSANIEFAVHLDANLGVCFIFLFLEEVGKLAIPNRMNAFCATKWLRVRMDLETEFKFLLPLISSAACGVGDELQQHVKLSFSHGCESFFHFYVYQWTEDT